jgi:uncharacterized protein
MNAVIVDTGPLVAYFDPADADHARVHAWFAKSSRRYTLHSTEAVLTEASHMLAFDVARQIACLEWSAQVMQLTHLAAHEMTRVTAWMRQYSQVPMDFADATVLWLHRQLASSSILTLDQRGFGVFRVVTGANERARPKFANVISL